MALKRVRSIQHAWAAVLGVLLVAYLAWLSPLIAPYAGGSDSSGYLWSARLLRHAMLSARVDVPSRFPLEVVGPGVFVPLGGKLRPGTLELVPTYPTGLPLHIAAASLLVSEESAVKAVLLFAAGGTLCVLYLLGREAGLTRLWAGAACLLIACSPLFAFLAVQPLSDVLATLWAETAVLGAWLTRRRRAFAVFAGASLGVATLVRPTNLLLLLPVAVALPATPGNYARLLTGALPFAAFLMEFQALAYAHPLASGYGDVSSAFSWNNVGSSLRHYMIWLPQLASWLVVLVPAAWWGWRGDLMRWRLIAGAWLLAIFGAYAFYVLTSETWWYLRFVLPAFPPLIIAGLVGLKEITRAVAQRVTRVGWPRVVDAAATVAIATCVGALVRGPQFDSYRSVKSDEGVYREALKLMTLETPPHAPVLMVQMTGAANYYAPTIRFLRFDRLTPNAWHAVRTWQAREGVAIEAALFPFEQEQMFPGGRPLLPCAWQPRGRYRYVTFWECPP